MSHALLSTRFYIVALTAAVIFSLAVARAGSALQNAQESAAQPGAKVFDTMDYRIRVSTVAQGMSYPFALAFLPDGSMLVTQLNGQVRMIRDGRLLPDPVGRILEVYVRESVAAGAAGLMDIALHPKFAENRLVYLTYNKPGERGATMALARGRFDGSQLTDVTDLFVADAWEKMDGNLTSRIAFATDGTLYMTVSYHNENKYSQDLNSHGGKVLRLRDDGTAPPDNPFAGRPGHRPEIFTYGHRGMHGIAIHPVTGDVWIAEHGDEVNILKAGANYGWPFFGVMGAGGGTPTPPAPRGLQVMDPYISWNPALNISGMMFYTGNRFPKWKGNLLVGGLSTQQVHRVAFTRDRPDLSAPLFTQIREALLTQIGGRVRDLRQGPDGLIYFVTYDERSGSVMRIEPAG
ncbi:MAG: hypothetical protein DMG13_10910 [Acidobacteria bacterium]|nr:MAG: hypothetical protein DMG13_10910 [Acidobacteriota bacterium]